MERKHLSYKDVSLEAVCYGTDGVKALVATTEKGVSKATLLNAAKDLRERGERSPENADRLETLACELEDYAVELFGEGGGTRGRAPLEVGESREYKVQQIKDGDPFLRLPVGLLKVEKGATVVARATEGEDGKITIVVG